jgi:hypothetical protein
MELPMGDVLGFSACFGCRRPFSFNPVRVPSIMFNGQKEPLCASCVERINPMRIANGLDPIVPLPDAYEACDESELI